MEVNQQRSLLNKKIEEALWKQQLLIDAISHFLGDKPMSANENYLVLALLKEEAEDGMNQLKPFVSLEVRTLALQLVERTRYLKDLPDEGKKGEEK